MRSEYSALQIHPSQGDAPDYLATRLQLHLFYRKVSPQVQAVVLHTPFQGCLTPGRRQDKRHRDVLERALEGGMQWRGRVKDIDATIAAEPALTSFDDAEILADLGECFDSTVQVVFLMRS